MTPGGLSGRDVPLDLAVGISLVGLSLGRNRIPREAYQPLPDPAREAERVAYNAAIAESNERCAQREFLRDHAGAQRQVFASTLKDRINQLVSSRPTL